MKIIIAAFAFLFLAGCESKSKNLSDLKSSISENKEAPAEKPLDRKNNGIGSVEFYQTDSTGTPDDPDQQKQKQTQQVSPKPNPDWDKKIIKTAAVNLEVKDYNKYYGRLRENVRSFGGYIAQEEQTQNDYKIENIITIKVPVDQFDIALTQLSADVEKVNEKKITSEDVTAEYIDTRSRIEAKKQVRLRYIDLLKQAKNMEEILNVQSEINSIQEEIEAASGRIAYLGHASEYSTINLTYYQVLNSSAKDNDSPTFGSQVRTAFTTGWSWITDLFIGIVSIWPLLLVTLFFILFIRRYRFNKTKAAN